MADTKFTKIKRMVEEERDKKMRGEARLSSLQEEQTRIFNQINEEAGKEVSSVAEAEDICASLKSEIQSDIEEMERVLKEEGIEL